MNNFKKLIKEALKPNFLKEGVDREIWNDADDETRMQMIVDATDDSDLAERYFDRKWDELPPEISNNLRESQNSLTESQRQEIENYREMSFEVWYSPEDGYNIKGREEIINPSAFFDTYGEAVEHAELEIDGYLGEWEEDGDLLDDGDDDWVEDRDWAKLEENMALSKELENHPDFDVLVTALEDSLGIEIERNLRSGTYNGREGHYLRTPDVGTWTENAKESITRALDKASAKAQDHTFEYSGISDYEVEPGERSWDASIEFFADKEEEEEMWTDPAGGTHYGDDDDPASDYMEESVNEMDMNDPVLMGMRASKQSMDTDSTSGIDYDEALSLRIMRRELEKEIDQLWMDMEQEAEPEGGPIADRYGDEISSLEDRVYKINIQLMDYDMNESLNEDKVSASSIPEGPQRLKWYGKGLAKMMTPYDTEGPEGLLNALLDNPEDFPLHWDVAHAGTVDYMQDNFDIIVKYANDELGMLESVNEGQESHSELVSSAENIDQKLMKINTNSDWEEYTEDLFYGYSRGGEEEVNWDDIEDRDIIKAIDYANSVIDQYIKGKYDTKDTKLPKYDKLTDKFVDEELETPNELADESKQDTSASGAYESKEFDFKKMIKESLKPNYLK